nr:hypothetical protein [Tanacetum cinerariifolium]
MLPMIISIRIPHMLHLEGKLFESLGCLVLVRRDCIGSSKFTIYQMRKGCSVWSKVPNTNARETYAPPHKVLTNDDLLTEIFIRLPILSIHLFTCVSKQWLKILKSLAFTLKRSQICCLDSPTGLFVNHIRSSFDCDFVSLDLRINSRKYTIENSFTLGSTEEADKVKIFQSCNGLLLCIGSQRHAFDYVYNPSTNVLKILPEPDYANVDTNVYGCAGLRLAFDPTKSPYYKVNGTKRYLRTVQSLLQTT